MSLSKQTWTIFVPCLSTITNTCPFYEAFQLCFNSSRIQPLNFMMSIKFNNLIIMRAWHCAKVINYLRTVLNALSFRKLKNEENRGSLPCCRLLHRSISVSGDDQRWRPSIVSQNSSFDVCLTTLSFLCPRLKNLPVLCFFKFFLLPLGSFMCSLF